MLWFVDLLRMKALDEPAVTGDRDREKQKKFYMGRIEKMYLFGNVSQAVDADLYKMIIDIYHELKDINKNYQMSGTDSTERKDEVNAILARLAEIDP